MTDHGHGIGGNSGRRVAESIAGVLLNIMRGMEERIGARGDETVGQAARVHELAAGKRAREVCALDARALAGAHGELAGSRAG